MSEYYLLLNGQKHGPYSSSQLKAMASARQIARTDLVWKAGWTRWVAAADVKGIFPDSVTQGQHNVAIVRQPQVTTIGLPQASLPDTSTIPTARPLPPEIPLVPPTAAAWWLFGAVGACLALIVGWILYSWLTPLTPREVCERWNKSGSVAEAKKYCTLNMHRALEEVFKNPDPASDDPAEFTQEGAAPPNIGGYFVGVRIQLYEPELQRRVQIDGVIHLIQSDGWKIEDIYFLAIDHEQLAQPVGISWLAANGQLRQPSPPPSSPIRLSGGKTAKNWFASPELQKNAGRIGFYWLMSGGGRKWLAGIGILALAAISAFWQKTARPPNPNGKVT